MNDVDLFAFSAIVGGLEQVFPKRLDEHERAQRNREYFKALQRFPLNRVQAGADVWTQRGKFFPKPAEWIDAMPAQRALVTVPTMTEQEASEYHRAEALRYEDTPCACRECKAAQCEKPLRFVPELHSDGSERKVRDAARDRIVTAGRWIHGFELARWYVAKADFYNRYLEAVGGLKGMR